MKPIRMLQGAWYGDTVQQLLVPDSWSVSVWAKDRYSPAGASPPIECLIQQAVHDLVDVYKSTGGRRSVGIVVDDLTRPTPAQVILEPLLRSLEDVASAPDAIHLFPAIGGHRPLSAVDLRKKVGAYALGRAVVHHHSPFVGNTLVGENSAGFPVWVNSSFAQCEFKMLIGTVLPHSAVGVSGGMKLVVPGLAGIETIKALHSREIRGAYASLDNDKRRAIDSTSGLLNIDYAIYPILHPDRTLAAVFYGDPVGAHNDASKYVLSQARIEVSGTYNIGIMSAYPIDTEFVQAGKVFDMARINRQLFSEGASIVACVCATEGMGYHILRTPGFIEPFDDDWTAPYGSRELIFLSKNIHPQMLPAACRGKIRIFSSWPKLRRFLFAKHGSEAAVGVFPYPTVQVISHTAGGV